MIGGVRLVVLVLVVLAVAAASPRPAHAQDNIDMPRILVDPVHNMFGKASAVLIEQLDAGVVGG